MTARLFVMLAGLGLAAWGHLLVHDLLGAAQAWTRADERFPPPLRSTPSVAGVALLLMGALCVLFAMTS